MFIHIIPHPKFYMMRFNKILITMVIFAFSTIKANAQTGSDGFNWTKVINAIVHLESRGNPNAKNGNSLGILQITPSAVKECNNILKKKKINKRYTLEDRRNPNKSKEIFIHLQEHFNPEHDIEKAVKHWNVGFYVKNIKNKANGYYKKFCKQYSKSSNTTKTES